MRSSQNTFDVQEDTKIQNACMICHHPRFICTALQR